MEQDIESVDINYNPVCTTCLSVERNLCSINGNPDIYQIFRLIMYDFAGDRLGESILDSMEQMVCWECLALMRRFLKFKKQVHSAQEHLRVLTLSQSQESMDHTYMSQSLSNLDVTTKLNYDSIFFDYNEQSNQFQQHFITHSSPDVVKSEHYDGSQAKRESISIEMDGHLLEVPEIVLENPVTGVMSHIVVGTDALVTPATYTSDIKGELTELTVNQLHTNVEPVHISEVKNVIRVKKEPKDKSGSVGSVNFINETMTEEQLKETREEAKQKPLYASSVYKCELCIIGFYTQKQVEDHFVSHHREKPNHSACQICYTFVLDSDLDTHVRGHYSRVRCLKCGHCEPNAKLMAHHTHTQGQNTKTKKKRKNQQNDPPKPGDLRKLLSKTTIEGYKCLECDMFFQNYRARKNHVARYHREGLQCDHCKKRFVNKTTLATHMRLHEGPLPREECPVCHKMVRVIQLKYHIQRHENKSRYTCNDCNKVFSHLTTYQAHLKYSRAHASEDVFKYPCPMCNKGYMTKEAMQDHFNYQHLGKTAHKCPVCDKPIASKSNVEKHMARVHGEKKEKPRKHTCQICCKSFTDKKALTQHTVIHSGERPLSCDICHQTFKQKASLYTHRKRVHKMFPAKKVVQFMENKQATQ